MPDNPKHIQVSSDLEFRAAQLFLEAFRKALLAGLLQEEWQVGVMRPKGGKMRCVIDACYTDLRPEK